MAQKRLHKRPQGAFRGAPTASAPIHAGNAVAGIENAAEADDGAEESEETVAHTDVGALEASTPDDNENDPEAAIDGLTDDEVSPEFYEANLPDDQSTVPPWERPSGLIEFTLAEATRAEQLQRFADAAVLHTIALRLAEARAAIPMAHDAAESLLEGDALVSRLSALADLL